MISCFKFIQLFLIFILINRFTCKEKPAGEKKNPLKKRNVRLSIINALNLINCFKFIQIFLIFTSINRFMCKDKSAGQKKCPLITYALLLIFISINRFMYKEKSARERNILWNKEISVIEQSLFCFSCTYIHIYIYVILVKAC